MLHVLFNLKFSGVFKDFGLESHQSFVAFSVYLFPWPGLSPHEKLGVSTLFYLA